MSADDVDRLDLGDGYSFRYGWIYGPEGNKLECAELPEELLDRLASIGWRPPVDG